MSYSSRDPADVELNRLRITEQIRASRARTELYRARDRAYRHERRRRLLTGPGLAVVAAVVLAVVAVGWGLTALIAANLPGLVAVGTAWAARRWWTTAGPADRARVASLATDAGHRWRALPENAHRAAVAAAAFTTAWLAVWALQHVRSLILGVALLGGWRAVAWWRDRPYRGDGLDALVHAEAAPAVELPLEARAVAAGLDGTKARRYTDAVTAGELRPPTRTKDDHKDVIEFKLPDGVLPTDINLARFAWTLQVTEGRCRYGKARPGSCVVEVLDVDPADQTVGPWPLLGRDTDWTAPLPIGVDTDGHPATITLGGSRLLVVGMSGSGKTRLMRMVALHAAADPNVQLHVLDCKGGPALLPLEPRCVWFHRGVGPDVVAHLEAVRDEVRRRYKEGVTPETAGWVVVVADEVQALWKVKGAADVVEEIARTGREVGVGLVLGSHTPDKSSFPMPVRAQCDVRVAMRLTDAWATQMVLGEAVDASRLPKGHLYLASDDADTVTRVVSHHVDDDQARDHVARLPRVDRPEPEPAGPSLLDNVLSFLGGRVSAPWTEIADALGMDPDELRDRLRREHGVKSYTVRAGDGTGTGPDLRNTKKENVS